MNPEELKTRTKALALRVIRLARILPRDPAGRAVAGQIVRSATSVGANYRAACRAQSRATFSAKLAIAEEEADETLYWLEILSESGLVKPERLTELLKETREIVAIITASRRTASTRAK
ncbi:MAG: four helix bundle protein [Acidobacteria bacterium]|nr:four helix bundle protein [Acidobacteriota bacterium]